MATTGSFKRHAVRPGCAAAPRFNLDCLVSFTQRVAYTLNDCRLLGTRLGR